MNKNLENSTPEKTKAWTGLCIQNIHSYPPYLKLSPPSRTQGCGMLLWQRTT